MSSAISIALDAISAICELFESRCKRRYAGFQQARSARDQAKTLVKIVAPASDGLLADQHCAYRHNLRHARTKSQMHSELIGLVNSVAARGACPPTPASRRRGRSRGAILQTDYCWS